MFNFSERTLTEKIVLIGAGTLVVGNTVVNAINSVKIHKVKKRVTNCEGKNNQTDNNNQSNNQ